MVDFNWNTDTMTPNQYKVADYIQKNFNFVLLSTEQEISDALEISIASVSRFWQTVGYKNFKDFKTKMKKNLINTPARKMENTLLTIDRENLEHHYLHTATSHLEKTFEHLSQKKLNEAVRLITNAQTVYLHSPGPSVGLGALMTYRLSRFGLNIFPVQKGGSEIFEDLLAITKDDIIFLFGFGRLLPEGEVLLKHAKEIGAKTIILTDQLVSPFMNDADIVLFASRGELWEFHSMIAPTFLIENLIIAIGMEHQEENLLNLEKLSELRKKFSDHLPR